MNSKLENSNLMTVLISTNSHETSIETASSEMIHLNDLNRSNSVTWRLYSPWFTIHESPISQWFAVNWSALIIAGTMSIGFNFHRNCLSNFHLEFRSNYHRLSLLWWLESSNHWLITNQRLANSSYWNSIIECIGHHRWFTEQWSFQFEAKDHFSFISFMFLILVRSFVWQSHPPELYS